jgi:hypothetical protein
MAWNQRGFTGHPIVVDQVKVTVTNPAVTDRDLDIVEAERGWFGGSNWS